VEVLQAWRQGTLRAAGATALAPSAIVAATGVIALGGGGLGGLGSLGQLLSGPAPPDSSARASTGEGPSARTTSVGVPPLVAVRAGPGTGGGAGAGGGTSGGGAPASGPGTDSGGSPTGNGPSAGVPGAGSGGENAPGGSAAPTPPAAPAAPLAPVGNAINQITAPLPEPVRSTADRVVDTATGTTGRALVDR